MARGRKALTDYFVDVLGWPEDSSTKESPNPDSVYDKNRKANRFDSMPDDFVIGHHVPLKKSDFVSDSTAFDEYMLLELAPKRAAIDEKIAEHQAAIDDFNSYDSDKKRNLAKKGRRVKSTIASLIAEMKAEGMDVELSELFDESEGDDD